MDKKQKEEQLMELAKFYFLNSKLDEAFAEFKKILEINPMNAEVYCNLGLIYENRQMPDDAKKMYEKAIQIDKNNKIAADHLNRLTGITNE